MSHFLFLYLLCSINWQLAMHKNRHFFQIWTALWPRIHMYKWLRATGTGGETQTGSCVGVRLSVAPCLSEGKHPPRFPKRINTQIHCEITRNTSYSLSPQSGFVNKKTTTNCVSYERKLYNAHQYCQCRGANHLTVMKVQIFRFKNYIQT